MTTLIVDYGMGNLRSVQKAFERIGEDAQICSDPQQVAEADRVVLPGVGAFRDAVNALHEHQLVDVLQDHIAADRPFLGICLGLQMLFEESLEDGVHRGLGVIPGKVRRFDLSSEYKIPHMGWNQLQLPETGRHSLFAGVDSGRWFYFVHSYHCEPAADDWTAATTDYGYPFVSAVARGNVMATQFHPEKSQASGMQILRNFLAATETAVS
jgi:glutamine amidotransferase